MLFVILFIMTLIFDYLYGTNEDDTDDYQGTLILFSLSLASGFIKLLNALRIFNNISFIVRMLTKVMLTLVPFLVLFMEIIIVFICI